MLPLGLLRVQSRLDLPGAVGAGPAAARHTKPFLQQHVEGLLQEGVFQEEPARVTVVLTSVWVAALVQCVFEHLSAQRNLPCGKNKKLNTKT